MFFHIFGLSFIFSHATYNSTIQMSGIENRLFDLGLPDFLIRFKQAGVNKILPLLDSAIAYLNQTDSPLLMVLLIILFVQLLRLALIQPPQAVQTGITAEQRQLGRELKELKKEMKSIQNMLIQLKDAKPVGSKIVSAIDPAATNRAIESCKANLSKREAIAQHILDWQTKIIEQVIKLKKRAGGSRSPSKISISQSHKKVSTIKNENESSKKVEKKAPPKKAASSKKNSSIQKIVSQPVPYTITMETVQIKSTQVHADNNQIQVVESIREEKTEITRQEVHREKKTETNVDPIIEIVEQVIEVVEEPVKIEEIKVQTAFAPPAFAFQREETTAGFDQNEGNLGLDSQIKPQAAAEEIEIIIPEMPKPPKIIKKVPPTKGVPNRKPPPPVRKV